MHDAGRVGFAIRGDYSSTETYDFLDVVYYNYSSYVAKKETTGNIPVEDSEYWHILAKGALFGVSGVKGEKETGYRTGDVNITAEDVGALPVEGGIISSPELILLKLHRKLSGGYTAIDFQNDDGRQIRVMCGPDVGEGGLFEVFSLDDEERIFRVSKRQRMIYDAQSNSLKKVLVEGEALPLTGGTIESASNPLLHIRRTLSQGDAILQLNPNNFANKGINVQASHPAGTEKLTFKVFQVGLDTGSGVNCLLEISDGLKNIYDHKTGKMKEILVEGDTITPTVKETAFVTNNGDLVVEGVKGADRTDITEIFIKSNTYKEGMIVGVSSNGMGYIVSQNFSIDCTKLTDSERALIQSFNAIRFSRANNSDDYPLLRPGTMNCEGGCGVTGKNGFARSTIKMQIESNSGQNYFQYELPSAFRNDDNSLNNLFFVTTNWNVLTGINIKKRG